MMLPFETLLKDVLLVASPFAVKIAKDVIEDIEVEVAKEAVAKGFNFVKHKVHSQTVTQSGIDKHLTLLSEHLKVSPQAKMTELLPRLSSEDEGLYGCC